MRYTSEEIEDRCRALRERLSQEPGELAIAEAGCRARGAATRQRTYWPGQARRAFWLELADKNKYRRHLVS